MKVLCFLSVLAEVLTAKIKSADPAKVEVVSTEKHRGGDAVVVNLKTYKLSISEGREEDRHPFEGVGALSAGASSRLLQDYPKEQRSEILDLLFKPRYGASLQVLKVEIGGDTQSTDGSEPSHMRFRGEKPDCSRGYEAWLMKEAKARNPEIRTYALAWGVPGWIGNGTFYSKDNIVYQVSWLQCIKDSYSIEVDYIGIWNEMHWGASWYVYELADAIKAAGLKTKLVLLDAVSGVDADFLAQFKQDEKLQQLSAAVGLHYPCQATPELLDALKPHPNTRFWASEELSTVADWGGAGCWGRMINQNFVRMNATSSIAWSLIWSAYPNLECFGNGLMYAFQPWSGFYEVTPPVWTMAHTTQFTEVGWSYLPVGEGAGLLPEGGTYVTIVSPDLKDFTIVVETLQGTCMYHEGCFHDKKAINTQRVSLKLSSRLEAAARNGDLEVWSTNTTHQFVRQAGVFVDKDGFINLMVPVDSIITISTVKGASKQGIGSSNMTAKELPSIPQATDFALPFEQSFDDIGVGLSPPFFADQGGAFEVVEDEGPRRKKGNKVLEQKVMQPPIAWAGFSPNPFTLFGGTNWTDVSAEVAVRLDNKEDVDGHVLHETPLVSFGKATSLLAGPGVTASPPGVLSAEVPRQAGLCVRVTRYQFFGSSTSKPDGYCVEVLMDSSLNAAYWRLTVSDTVLAAGHVGNASLAEVLNGGWFKLRLEARAARIKVWVNGESVADLIDTALPMGQVALGCAYHKCQFDDLHVESQLPVIHPVAEADQLAGIPHQLITKATNVNFNYNARSCNPPPTLTAKRSDFTGFVGFAFSPLAPASLVALGRLQLRGGSEFATAHTLELLEVEISSIGATIVNKIASVALPTMPNGQAGIESRDDGFLYADLKSKPILHPGKTYVISSSEITGGDFFYDRAVRAEATPSMKLIGPAYKGVSGGWQIEAQSADVTIYGPLNALLLDLPPPKKVCLAPAELQGYEVEETNLLIDHFHVVVSCAKGYVGVPQAQACFEHGGTYKLSGCHPEEIVKSPVEVVHSKSKLKNVTARTVEPNKTKVSGKVDIEIHHIHNQSQDHPNVTVEVKNVTGKVKSKVEGKIDIEIHHKGKDQDHPDVKVIHSKTEVKKIETGRVESKNTTKVTRDIDIKVSDNTTVTGKVTTEIHKVTTAPPSKSYASSVKIEVDSKKVEANLAKEAKHLGETVEVDQQQLEELSKVEQTEVDKKVEMQEKKEEQKKVDNKVEVQEKKEEQKKVDQKVEVHEKKDEQKKVDKKVEMQEKKEEASKQKQSLKDDNKEGTKATKADAKEEKTSLVKSQHGVAELNVEDVDTSPMEIEVQGTNTEDSTVSEVDAKYGDLMNEVSHALQDGKESHIAAA